MKPTTSTHIGDGQPVIVLKEYQRTWPGLAVTFRHDDIRRPTDWRIRDRRHAVVVHLGGKMNRLETELDGFGGSTGPALPGEVWTAPAERAYASHACGDQIYYALMFLEPTAPDTIQGSNNGRVGLAPVAGKRDEFLHQAVRELMNVVGATDDISEMLAESLSQTICLHLCRSYSPGQAAPKKPGAAPLLTADTARRLREFIGDNFSNRITLAALSRLAGLTTHQLLIAFRQAFGCTPGQYVIQQRLRNAQLQLLNTRKDIATIALDSGFSSHSHLAASFQRHCGCTPARFRAGGTPQGTGFGAGF